MRSTSLALVLVLASSLFACRHAGGDPPDAAAGPLRVAAASDLADAFTEIGKAYEASSGTHVDLTFGSTGQLARQITEGAPYDVLAAANVSYVDDVVKKGACLGDTVQHYARGRIVVWASDAARLPRTLDGLRDPRFARIAIANPEHAPYGLAARQALQHAGLWSDLERRVVLGENVQQALAFARSGNADVAVVALSLVVHGPGAFLPVDPALHEPLVQALVACKGGASGGRTTAARRFVEFVASDPGRAVMRRYGFLLPGDALSPAE
ncbi:MAG: Molybdenum transporter, periplasmic molybdenum-binding protein ModA [Labilithrix sp.]|nr:Molybdenum transporter, periplasmic molybdenum-binding protein ModA [Labilithrix sp.]